MVIVIDLDGDMDFLGMWFGEYESDKFWLSVHNDLKNRGLQDILITRVDNLTGFSQAISTCYSQMEIQQCIIHQVRHSTRYISYKNLKKVTADLNTIYKATTEENTLVALGRFEEVRGAKYPLIIRSWRNKWSELTIFFKYPQGTRNSICTSNIIERCHRQFRKAIEGKSIFPSDEALLKMPNFLTMDVAWQWTGRVHISGQMLPQLSVFFPDRVRQHLRQLADSPARKFIKYEFEQNY